MSKCSSRQRPAAKPRRDVRVDRIGFVKELVDNWIEKEVKPAVKGDMLTGDVVEGDYFLARLDPSTCNVISASGVMKLYENGTLSRAEFVELLTVNAEKARAVIDPKRLKRLTQSFVGTARLNVRRREGVQLEASDAIAKLNDVLAAGGLDRRAASQPRPRKVA
jgi:hypothetical protein